jgi:DNA invertase Pin-like site-specific DNA recombinase
VRRTDENVTRPSTGARIGYVRVSTVAQTLDQQQEALETAGVSKTFSDTMSGARDDRPGLAALMEYVREGDTVVVWKLDRLGRNTLHILETVKVLTDRGVTLVRTALKRDASRRNGTKFGRPRKVDDAEHIATGKQMKSQGHTAKAIAKYLSVSRATLYRYLNEHGAA